VELYFPSPTIFLKLTYIKMYISKINSGCNSMNILLDPTAFIDKKLKIIGLI